MTIQKYMGIENELISFRNKAKIKQFNFSENGLKKIYQNTNSILDTNNSDIIWSEIGNVYYRDGDEIEIATPPIALNKGFATRLTDMLITGRNHVIKRTPYLKHTGYSMHWNITRSSDIYKFYNEVLIPFQMFGLTPMSQGTCIKNKEERLEIAGDSLTNEDQIRATALLLGSHSLATETSDYSINFCDERSYIRYKKTWSSELAYDSGNILKCGRHTVIPIIENPYGESTVKEVQAQSILEVFYERLMPFVYKLGTAEEIRNLEAFVSGEKKLEIDDLKYFYMLAKEDAELNNLNLIDLVEGKYFPLRFDGMYKPSIIDTDNGTRSPILSVRKNIQLPLEGRMWKKSMNKTKFERKDGDWTEITIKGDNEQTITGIDNIYKMLEKISGLKYPSSLDCCSIVPKNITSDFTNNLYDKKSFYNPDTDSSANIKDMQEFLIYLQSGGYQYDSQSGLFTQTGTINNIKETKITPTPNTDIPKIINKEKGSDTNLSHILSRFRNWILSITK